MNLETRDRLEAASKVCTLGSRAGVRGDEASVFLSVSSSSVTITSLSCMTEGSRSFNQADSGVLHESSYSFSLLLAKLV
jgi:hypothetical protein